MIQAKGIDQTQLVLEDDQPDCPDFSLLVIGDSDRPYSGLRIDVQAGTPPKFKLQPLIAERFQRRWHNYVLEPVVIE